LGGAGASGGWSTVHLHFALYKDAHFQNTSSGIGPYGGQAVVPEPFASCIKNDSQSCENFVNQDRLAKGGNSQQQPSAPNNLTASATGQTSIHLTWQETDSVDSFKVYRDNAPQSPLGTVGGGIRQFDDSNALRCHTPYWYHVVATKNGVDSSQGTVPAQTADCSSSNPTNTPQPSGGNANFTLTSPSYNVQTNQQVNVTIHLHVNSGQFRESSGDHLYGLDSNLYGAYLIQPIKGTVSAGQDFDFNFNMTAPSSPGTYTTHWQMKVGGNLIGNPATVTLNASSPPPPPPPPGNMHVEYFRDTGLGDHCYDGYENSTYVSKDWGDGAPNSNCPVDYFGARFTETLSFPGGQYRFHCEHDDACRIYIDGDKKLDEPSSGGHDWYGNVSAGNHEIKVEYYDNTGGAHIDAWWQGPGYLPSDQDCSSAPTQWCAWYWLNRTLSGTPAVIQLEGDPINHAWNGSSPFPALPSTNFSARFTRQAAFDCGTYRFHVFADDGVRLYIDDVLQPQFDQWHDPSAAHYYGDIALTGGTHNLRVEYYQAGGWDGLQVDWAKTSDVGPSCATATPTATPPVVSVEDVSTSDMSHTRTTTFNTGDTIIFGIDATNHSATTQPSTWSWQTVDAFGTEIAALSVDSWQYSMPPGSGGAGWRATIPADLPSGTYTLIGRVTIGDTSDTRQVSFTVHNTRPAPPTLLSPSTGAIVNQSDPLTLSWSSSNGQMFAVEVATDSNFSTIVGESYWASSATSFTLSTPPSYMEAGTYYWHVKTRVGSIESAWSDTWSFTVQGIATTATATAQSTTATVQPSSTATAATTVSVTMTSVSTSTTTATSTSITRVTNTPTSTATATNTPTHMPTSTSTATGIATDTPTSTATPTNTPPISTPANTATNTPTSTSTSTPTNTPSNAPTDTPGSKPMSTPTATLVTVVQPPVSSTTAPGGAAPTPVNGAAPTPTNGATTPPAPNVPTAPTTVGPTPRPLHGCVVAALNLAAPALRGVRNPRPTLTVNDVRNARGEGSRATSYTPVFYADGQGVSFSSGRSYQALVCARYTLVDLKGVVLGGQSHPRGHGSTNLRGDRFELTVTEDSRRRRQPATFSVRLRIPRVHYDRTTRSMHGRLDVKR